MKMKTVCERTNLTERAVRLYIEKGLLSPECEQVRGRTYYEFDEEDIEILHAIAVLRGTGFSLDAIYDMIHDAQKIAPLFQNLVKTTIEKAEEYQEITTKLQAVEGIDCCETVQELASRIEQSEASAYIRSSSVRGQMGSADEEMTFRFGAMDEESAEERQEMYEAYLGHRYLRKKREKQYESFLALLSPIRKTSDRYRRQRKYIWRIALAILCCATVYLLIPRKVSDCMEWDRELVGACITIEQWNDEYTGLDPKQNFWTIDTYIITEEMYDELLKIMGRYSYHGYLNALFYENERSWTGGVDMITIVCSTDGIIYISGDGRISIRGHSYYLDWFGSSNSEKLCEEIITFLESEYTPRE